MTLLQLKYIAGTISEAAKRLYITQPSLTASVKELEKELGITIFNRTNKGIVLSAEGEEFLGYARQVIDQTSLIAERYLGAVPVKHQFCVSAQHYSFAVEAFVDLVNYSRTSPRASCFNHYRLHNAINVLSSLTQCPQALG
jgi:DNA-binding transcriptional LysR family regulator